MTNEDQKSGEFPASTGDSPGSTADRLTNTSAPQPEGLKEDSGAKTKRNWTDEDVQNLWPQAFAELSGFANVLEQRNAGLTAAQLRMALDLAQEAVKLRAIEPEQPKETLTCYFDCRECGLKRQPVEIPKRHRATDIRMWMERILPQAVQKVHQEKSPGCMSKHILNLMIPAPDDAEFIGQKDNPFPLGTQRPQCVLHPDRPAITTAAQIPVCKDCEEKYKQEGRKYLPIDQRAFYRQLLEADEKRQR